MEFVPYLQSQWRFVANVFSVDVNSLSSNDLFEAYQHISSWKLNLLNQDSVSVAVEASHVLIRAHLNDILITNGDSPSWVKDYNVSYVLGMAITRFLNVLSELRPDHLSLMQWVEKHGIPDWIVYLRNDIVHGITYPELTKIREGFEYFWTWISREFYQKTRNSTDSNDAATFLLLNEDVAKLKRPKKRNKKSVEEYVAIVKRKKRKQKQTDVAVCKENNPVAPKKKINIVKNTKGESCYQKFFHGYVQYQRQRFGKRREIMVQINLKNTANLNFSYKNRFIDHWLLQKKFCDGFFISLLNNNFLSLNAKELKDYMWFLEEKFSLPPLLLQRIWAPIFIKIWSKNRMGRLVEMLYQKIAASVDRITCLQLIGWFLFMVQLGIVAPKDVTKFRVLTKRMEMWENGDIDEIEFLEGFVNNMRCVSQMQRAILTKRFSTTSFTSSVSDETAKQVDEILAGTWFTKTLRPVEESTPTCSRDNWNSSSFGDNDVVTIELLESDEDNDVIIVDRSDDDDVIVCYQSDDNDVIIIEPSVENVFSETAEYKTENDVNSIWKIANKRFRWIDLPLGVYPGQTTLMLTENSIAS